MSAIINTGGSSGSGGITSIVAKTTSYTATSADNGKLFLFNGQALQLTLPNPAPAAGWAIAMQDITVGGASPGMSISPNGLNLNGTASFVFIGPFNGVFIYSDGTNYFTGPSTPSAVVLNPFGAQTIVQPNTGGVPFNITSSNGGDVFFNLNHGGTTLLSADGANGNRILISSLQAGGQSAVAALTGTGACGTITTQTGGAWAGSAKCTGVTGAATLTITPGQTAANGWVCSVQDETTRANLFQQTSHSTTACTLTATSVTQNDVFVFTAIGF